MSRCFFKPWLAYRYYKHGPLSTTIALQNVQGFYQKRVGMPSKLDILNSVVCIGSNTALTQPAWSTCRWEWGRVTDQLFHQGERFHLQGCQIYSLCCCGFPQEVFLKKEKLLGIGTDNASYDGD